jgi:hypothetical protein
MEHFVNNLKGKIWLATGLGVLIAASLSCDLTKPNNRNETSESAKQHNSDDNTGGSATGGANDSTSKETGAGLTPCPVTQGLLCKDLPGFGSTPENYCTMPRLSAIRSIPKECPQGACLLVATVDSVITVAMCWDAKLRPVVLQ